MAFAFQKEGGKLDQSSILRKMCDVGFPGSEKYVLFKDPSELICLLNFILQISVLCSLKRTGGCTVGMTRMGHSHVFNGNYVRTHLKSFSLFTCLRN